MRAAYRGNGVNILAGGIERKEGVFGLFGRIVCDGTGPWPFNCLPLTKYPVLGTILVAFSPSSLCRDGLFLREVSYG